MKKHLLFLLFLFPLTLFAQKPAYLFHEKGMELFKAGNYAGAIAQFDLAIKADATYFEAWTDRGRANYNLGKKDLALSDFNQSAKLNPRFAPTFFWRAVVFTDMGQDQNAIADYSVAQKLNQDFVDTYLNRGKLYIKTAQYDLALADFNKAISLDGKNGEIYYQRGLLQNKSNKTTEAINDFNKAAALTPTLAGPHFELGKIYATQNKHDQAVAELGKAIALKQTGEEVYKIRAASLTALSRDAEAIKDYSTLIDIMKTKDIDVIRLRGDLFVKQKNWAAAVKDYNKALALKKDDVPTLLARGKANYMQGKSKYAMAKTDFNKVLAADGNNAEASLYIGKILFEENKFQEAVDALSVAIKNNPSAEAYYIRSKCYYKLENKKACCEDLSKAQQMGHPEAARDKMTVGCK